MKEQVKNICKIIFILHIIIILMFSNGNVLGAKQTSVGGNDAQFYFEVITAAARRGVEEGNFETYLEGLENYKDIDKIKQTIAGKASSNQQKYTSADVTDDFAQNVLKKIEKEIEKERNPGQSDTSAENNNMTEEQKKEVEDNVNSFIEQLENSDMTKEQYLEEIKKQMNITIEDYTEEQNQYRLELYQQEYDAAETVYSDDSTGVLGESTANNDYTVDDVINNANNFIEAGKNEGSKIDSTNLQQASNTLYNILLSIGIVIAVAVGMYLGVKFMMSSAEDKAKVKESLIPYIAGCVVIFGAFIIWKLAILLLNGLA